MASRDLEDVESGENDGPTNERDGNQGMDGPYGMDENDLEEPLTNEEKDALAAVSDNLAGNVVRFTSRQGMSPPSSAIASPKLIIAAHALQRFHDSEQSAASLKLYLASVVALYVRQKNEYRNSAPHPREGTAGYLVDIMKKVRAKRAKDNYEDKGKRTFRATESHAFQLNANQILFMTASLLVNRSKKASPITSSGTTRRR